MRPLPQKEGWGFSLPGAGAPMTPSPAMSVPCRPLSPELFGAPRTTPAFTHRHTHSASGGLGEGELAMCANRSVLGLALPAAEQRMGLWSTS